MSEIKKSWFWSSVAMNVLLAIGCLVLVVRHSGASEGKGGKEPKINTNMLFSAEYADDDILLIGGERMRICAWRNLIGDNRICNLSLYQNTIDDELNRAEFIFDNHSPRQIILMLGLQDLKEGKDVNVVYGKFVEYVNLLREKLPQTEIVIHSLMPLGPDKYNDFKDIPTESIVAYNLFLKMFALEQGLVFLNMYDEFADGNGLLAKYNTGDGYHLTEVAYRQWKDRLQSVMQ